MTLIESNFGSHMGKIQSPVSGPEPLSHSHTSLGIRKVCMGKGKATKSKSMQFLRWHVLPNPPRQLWIPNGHSKQQQQQKSKSESIHP